MLFAPSLGPSARKPTQHIAGDLPHDDAKGAKGGIRDGPQWVDTGRGVAGLPLGAIGHISLQCDSAKQQRQNQSVVWHESPIPRCSRIVGFVVAHGGMPNESSLSVRRDVARI